MLDKTVKKIQDKNLFKIKQASVEKPKLNFIPTGSLKLDFVMGGKGYPQGKITEIYGEPSSGKSLLALLAEATVTRRGGTVIHCDLEGSYSHLELDAWRKSFGGDPNLIYDIPQQPAEDVINGLITLLEADKENQIELIIIDSVGALVTEKRIEKDAGEGHIDEVAKMLNLLCRKLSLFNSNTAVLALNHVMSNIGSRNPKPIAKGGFGLKHWASLRLEVWGKAERGQNDFNFAEYQNVNVTVQKNKVGIPLGRADDLVFSFSTGGFDILLELIELGVAHNIINQKGAHFYLDGVDGSFHGKDKLKELFSQPNWADWLFQRVTGKTMAEYGYAI